MMRSDPVVLSEPNIDGDLRLLRAVKPLGIEHFSSQGSVEALVVSVFPWASRVDLHRLDANLLRRYRAVLGMRPEPESSTLPSALPYSTVGRAKIRHIRYTRCNARGS